MENNLDYYLFQIAFCLFVYVTFSIRVKYFILILLLLLLLLLFNIVHQKYFLVYK
jgi:hypothetical protein